LIFLLFSSAKSIMRINTRILMTASALIMMGAGIALSFLPGEIWRWLYGEPATGTQHPEILLQIIGALYFAFGMVNWTSKGNLIGGIYGRPIAIGNLTHFIIAGIALVKYYFANPTTVLLPVAVMYAILALLFSIVFFTHPLSKKD